MLTIKGWFYDIKTNLKTKMMLNDVTMEFDDYDIMYDLHEIFLLHRRRCICKRFALLKYSGT